MQVKRTAGLALLIATSMAFGALADRSTIPRPYGGSFPAVVGDSDNILALTVGESPPGMLPLIREKATGQLRVLPIAETGTLVQAGSERQSRSSLAESTETAAEAAATLLPQRAGLAYSDTDGTVREVALINGEPATLETWNREQERMLQQIVEDGVETLREWSATLTLESGSEHVLTAAGTETPSDNTSGNVWLRGRGSGTSEGGRETIMTASGAIIRTENTTEATWQRLQNSSSHRIVDGYLHLVHTEPELRSSGRLPAEALIPPGMEGTSAGLAYAIAHLDHALGGDLTGGRLIAATGVIRPDGQTGPVVGLAAKSEAARQAEADMLLVATGSSGQAVIPAVVVWNLTDAVVALCREAPATLPETRQLCSDSRAEQQQRAREHTR